MVMPTDQRFEINCVPSLLWRESVGKKLNYLHAALSASRPESKSSSGGSSAIVAHPTTGSAPKPHTTAATTRAESVSVMGQHWLLGAMPTLHRDWIQS